MPMTLLPLRAGIKWLMRLCGVALGAALLPVPVNAAISVDRTRLIDLRERIQGQA